MKAAFFTLGCKVNQYETEVLKGLFAKAQFEIVEPGETADVYIINSCTVTASGDKKTRQIIHRCARNNPDAVIALTGCLPQAFPEEAKAFSQVQVITGAKDRTGLLQAVQKALQTGERILQITPHKPKDAFEPMQTSRFAARTRAFVKIEDGCDRYCSYCIIPKARGPVRSKPLDELRRELESLAQNGYREVVLVGINLSSYGKDLKLHLTDAIQTAAEVDGIHRVRLGSLEPDLLTDAQIDVMAATPKFCPQFHLSLQSGCDATLQRMNRHYDTAFYRDLIQKLRARMPDCAITTDIMVGFAGETEEEFAQSLAFAEEIGFAKTHVFAYSIRPGTKAATLPDQLTNAVKERRSKQMIDVTEQSRRAFLQAQVGKRVSVLFETEKGGVQEGYAENYTPVHVVCDQNLSREIRTVLLTDVTEDACIGTLVEA